MNISQVKVIEFVHQISVGMLRIGIRNTFAGTAGRKSNARFLASNLIADSCQYLQDKSRTVFNAASVAVISFIGRSEEHTSELQSRFDLVCRLLLEKKNSRLVITDIYSNITYD